MKVTNSDRIRNMTDEELAALLEEYICDQVNECRLVEFLNTEDGISCHIHNKCTWDMKCSDCVLDWLKQEAEENEG